MTWQVVERRIAGQTTKPASMSLRCVIRKGVAVSRPNCIVTLRYALASQSGWKSKEPISMIIGADEHAGLLRLIRGGENTIAKVRILQRGGLSVNLGFIPQFGLVPHKKRATDAKWIDDNTIEVVIPDWDEERPHDDGDDYEVEIDETMRSAPAPEISANGVTIIFEDENETVSFRDKEIEVTTRQAKFMAALTAEMPKELTIEQIVKRMWGSQAPLRAAEVVEQIWRDLTAPLSEIGLDLRKSKIGYGVSAMEAA